MRQQIEPVDRQEMKKHLMQLRHGWIRLSKKIGDVQARILLGIVYVLLVVPLGYLMRIFSDPLRLKPSSGSNWIERKIAQPQLEDAKRQF